jgi:hypothetical protein
MPASKRKRTSRFIAYSLYEFPLKGLVIESYFITPFWKGKDFFSFFSLFNHILNLFMMEAVPKLQLLEQARCQYRTACELFPLGV